MKKLLAGNFIADKKEKWRKEETVPENMIKMLVILLITTVISEVMNSLNLGNQNIIMVYMLAVLVISSTTSTYVYGIMAALIGTFCYDFLVTEPRMGFSFTTGLPITLFIMLLVTVLTSTMTTRVKAGARIAHEREQRTQQLYEIIQKLLVTRNVDAIVALTEEYLMGYLRRPVILYTKDPSLPDSGYGEAPEGIDEQGMLLYTSEQKRRVHITFRIGISEAERPFDDSEYDVYNLPAISRRQVLGVIGIACKGHPLSEGELIFVKMLANQVAIALELQYLSDKQSLTLIEAEKEKMRGTLLRSIAHDLRTPLAGILSASSTLLVQKNLDAEAIENMVKGIKLDAQWLIRMVENILIVTRMSGENLNVHKQPGAADEIVSEAVSIVRKRFPGYIFHAHIPDQLLLVPMDGTLISQVLINLLENAVRNSPDGSLILVDLRKKDDYAEFDVIDNGFGIPDYMQDSLFEVHATREQAADSSRGTGLGLSICKTIVQAHGGTIEGSNRSKQGAKFSFRLPLREAAQSDE